MYVYDVVGILSGTCSFMGYLMTMFKPEQMSREALLGPMSFAELEARALTILDCNDYYK